MKNGLVLEDDIAGKLVGVCRWSNAYGVHLESVLQAIFVTYIAYRRFGRI